MKSKSPKFHSINTQFIKQSVIRILIGKWTKNKGFVVNFKLLF